MGFFYASQKTASASRSSKRREIHIPIESMRKMGCKACPLSSEKLNSPKMDPEGTESPLIYILGEAPGQEEDKDNLPFTGKAENLLKSQFSSSFLRNYVRLGNTIKCSPPSGRSPEFRETECCRNYVAEDIERSKPRVIIGAGNAPLSWATDFNSATLMRGRLIPVKINSHVCWFYSILSPYFVLKRLGKYNKSEHELAFEKDLQWIIHNLDTLSEPEYVESGYDDGLILIEGRDLYDFRKLEDTFNSLLKNNENAIDLETNALRPYIQDPKIYMCSIGTITETVAFPLDDPRCWTEPLRKKAWGLLGDFIVESGKKIAHHLAFEMEWLSFFYGKSIAYLTEWGDTMAEAHTLDERVGVLGLEDLTGLHFGFNLKKQSDVDPVRLLEFPVRSGLRYNGMDSKWTHGVHLKQRELLENHPSLLWEADHQERLQPALVFTQQRGLCLDFNTVQSLEAIYSEELLELERKIQKTPEVKKYTEKYGTFLITSPQAVSTMLKEICKRTEVVTESGKLSSDEDILKLIPGREVPSAPLLLEHRQLSKVQGTYIVPVKERKFVYPDNKLHTKYNSLRAVTGRLASEEPNVQNFPKRKRREVRSIVVAPPNHWMVACDYGQIEARVFAMASEDKNLCDALWTGYDIHGFWADRVLEAYPKKKDIIIREYGVDSDDKKVIRKKARDEMKNMWVFPQFFGSSFRSCAADLQIPEDVAEDLSKEFWDNFPGIMKWQKWLMNFYQKNLYVETLTGRRRRGIMTKNEMLNHPIQGTAADIVKESQIELAFTATLLDDEILQPVLNVHDDLTFYIPDSGLESYLTPIAKIMCRPRFDFINVPIILEVQVGESWDSLEEVAVYKSNELYDQRR